MERKIITSPSIMCADLLNLESSVKELENIEVDALHIDIIDGVFSPSMPLGIDTVRRLRDKTDLAFDVHIMSTNNEWFVEQILDIGVQQISFHYETTLHADRLVNLIKRKGAKAGIALNPATPLSCLEYLLPQLDNVLLMLINPGFAGDKSEQQVAYADDKVKDLARIIADLKIKASIQVDGRVSLDSIPRLIQAGADNLVLGSTSLYIPGHSLADNKANLDEAINKGLSFH
ncbi:ribulose-phosphate 3-epimerase [Sodalis sp. RH21]|uniref:ribulose-phosphate 3-epimerase n=1 Tax=unclassified Sodalis (in: enterobacteria) TaxID=2636512 RepID=UPI0039B38356